MILSEPRPKHQKRDVQVIEPRLHLPLCPPQAAELKRAVRDILEPGRNLGHNDGNVDAAGDDEGSASVAVKRLLGLFGGLRPESKSRAEAKLRRKI